MLGLEGTQGMTVISRDVDREHFEGSSGKFDNFIRNEFSGIIPYCPLFSNH